jgi:hypothetical protein
LVGAAFVAFELTFEAGFDATAIFAGVLVVADAAERDAFVLVPVALLPEPAAFAPVRGPAADDVGLLEAFAGTAAPVVLGAAFPAVVFGDSPLAGPAFGGVLVDVRGGVFTATIRFLPGLAQPASPACG